MPKPIWKRSKAGNEFVNINGLNMGTYADDALEGRYKWRVGNCFSQMSYFNTEDAKAALLDCLRDAVTILETIV
jgi:hypothetical protein